MGEKWGAGIVMSAFFISFNHNQSLSEMVPCIKFKQFRKQV